MIVRWPDGLHLRRAVAVVTAAKRFRSIVRLSCGDRIADLRSILSVVALCATMGTGLDVEAIGEDEQEALQAIEQVFAAPTPSEAAETAAEKPRGL